MHHDRPKGARADIAVDDAYGADQENEEFAPLRSP